MFSKTKMSVQTVDGKKKNLILLGQIVRQVNDIPYSVVMHPYKSFMKPMSLDKSPEMAPIPKIPMLPSCVLRFFFLDSNCCWSMIESQPIGWWNPMNLHWNPILVPHYWCLDQHLPIKCVFHSVLPGEIPFLLPHYRSMIPCRISWFIRIFYLQPKARILIYPSLYFLISILHCIYCIPWGCLLISLYPQKIGLRIVRPRIFRPTPELPSSGHSDDHSSIETYGVLGDSLCPLRIPKIHHKVLWFYWQTNLSASFHHKYDKWWLNMIKLGEIGTSPYYHIGPLSFFL